MTEPRGELIERPDDLAALRAMPTDGLRAELAGRLRLTAEHLMRLGAVIRVLEERGEDLRGLRAPLLPYLRMIGHGQVLPDLVVRFADRPLLIQRSASLPLPDQRRLGAGEPVRLVVPAPEGAAEAYTHRMLQPADLGRDQITQVFGPQGLRDAPAQIAWLEARRAARSRPAARRAAAACRPDRERQGIVVGRHFVGRADALEALAGLSGGRGGEEEGEGAELPARLLVPLSEAEHRRLKVAAAAAGATMTELARRALRAAGLI